MGYRINPTAMKSVLLVPTSAIENTLKLATAAQLKVLLWCFCDTSAEISAEKTASSLSLNENEVADALLFWAQKGIFLSDDDKPVAAEAEKTKGAPLVQQLPTREDVARRGNEDEKIRMLLNEAQLKFGRNLKTNESRILVWLYDDRGMELSVLLLLLHYASSEGRLTISFIEKTALSWLDSGVETVADAEAKIAERAREQLCWKTVRTTFGIDRAMPSKKEQEYSVLWIEQWGLSTELLRAAYDICIDSTAKLSFPYIAKILKKWHEDGVKSTADIKKEATQQKAQKSGLANSAGYDISAFENMLNNDD